jgi:hypothetical protein
MTPLRRSERSNQQKLSFAYSIRPATASADQPDTLDDESPTPEATSLRILSRDLSPSGSSISFQSTSSSNSHKRSRSQSEQELVDSVPKRLSWVFNHMPNPDPQTIYWKDEKGARVIAWKCKYCPIDGWATSGGTHSAITHLTKYHQITKGADRQDNKVTNEQDRVV